MSNTIVANFLDQFQMNKNERDRVSNLNYLYNGLIVQGYHHFIFGSAGSGKTTLMTHLSIEISKQNKDIIIYYFYLDGTQNMASNISFYIEEVGLSDRIKILTTGSASEYTQMMNKILEANVNLNNIVFIYDTFKFLTSDINVKNANKEAMHFINEFTKRGATFISIGHSNKDGKRQSGTAEIEQDSDALLRIDGVLDENGMQRSTIKKEGRSRMDIIETSFQFQAGNISSVQRLNKVIEVNKIIAGKLQESSHRDIIDSIIELISENPLKQSEILQQSKSHPILASIGQNKIGKILKQYSNKYWKIQVGQNNSHYYMLLENNDKCTLLN